MFNSEYTYEQAFKNSLFEESCRGDEFSNPCDMVFVSNVPSSDFKDSLLKSKDVKVAYSFLK